MNPIPSSSKSILGIDVSKADFHAFLRTPTNKELLQTFANSPTGFKACLKWLEQHCPLHSIHACMEATGSYSDALASFLHPHLGMLSVVNPLRIHAYGQCKLRRCKTDPADARLIADFTQTQCPEPWSPPSKAQVKIKALSRRIADLKEEASKQKNRLKQASDPDVLASLRSHIAYLLKQIQCLTSKLISTIKSEPALLKAHQLIDSIPGIGPDSAAFILAELPDIKNFATARQLAAFAGITPAHKKSGTSGKSQTPISKKGSPYLRKFLFFPAMTAMRRNQKALIFAQRLQANGKRPLAIIVAIMAKLLHWIFGLLKNQSTFDPAFSS